MDKFSKSIEKIKEHFTETTFEEQSRIWDLVTSMKINGPSVGEYFDALKDHNAGYIEQLESVYSKSYDVPDSHLGADGPKYIAGESNYCLAA